MSNSILLKLNRIHWDTLGRHASAIAATHMVHQGKLVDCFAELADEYASRLDLCKDDRVLEVGCGSGCLLNPIRPRVGEIVGADFSAGMLRHLEGTGIETHCCEANALPFPDAAFDKVYLHSLAHYFPDETYAEQAVCEMLRVCKPGGRVLVGDVLNGLLKQDYDRASLRLNWRGLKRLKKLLIDYVARPIYQRLKYGQCVRMEPLSLTPFFFKRLLHDTPHCWVPLLETVESKPLPFLQYRYDVVIVKDGKRLVTPVAWSA